MVLLDFLNKVLPDTGIYYVATVGQNSKFSQQAINSPTELADYVAKATSQHKDTFFATGTFNTKSRTAEKAKLKKALYLDLDCGVDKEFPTKSEAIKALVGFCRAASIPTPSIIVDSGNGVHTYWVLDKAIPPNQWLPIAEALKDACEEHNFPADPSVTADTARILRAPESVNYKDIKHPKPCAIFKDLGKEYSYEEIRHSLLKWMAPAPLQSVPSILQDNGALSEGVGGNYVPLAKHIFEQCGVMKEVLATGGEGYSEMFWQQTLYLLAFCGDGADYAHKISEKHAQYNQRETERKWQQQLHKAVDGKHKPTLCATFEISMPDKCGSCEHKGCIKSPTGLGKPPATDMPYGYSQDGRQTILTDADGEKMLVMPYGIDDFRVIDDPNGEGKVVYCNIISGGQNIPLRIATSWFNDARAFNTNVCNRVALHQYQIKAVSTLMSSWTQQMINARQVKTATNSFGWAKEDKRIGFTISNATHWDDGTTESAIITPQSLSDMYSVVGDLAPWCAAANFMVAQGRQSINLVIASAFASPLIQFTGVSGLTLAVISEASGTGKSTALKVAQAVWGNPATGVNALTDTNNSVIKKFGKLKNLPAYWDELRMREQVEEFIKLTFQLGQGKEKSRLDQTSKFQEMGTWNLLMTVASNEYLTDYLDQIVTSSDAGRRRVFEVEVPTLTDNSLKAENMQMFLKLEHNFGAAGEIYAKYLAENHVAIRADVVKWMDNFSAKLSTDNNERFWIAYMAVTIVGASIAKKLGLVEFDLPAMAKYLMVEFNKLRTAAPCVKGKSTTKAHDLLTGFLDDHSAQIITIDKAGTQGVRPALLNDSDRKPVLAELGREDGIVRINAASFRAYVTKKGQQVTPIISELEASISSFKYKKVSLGSAVPGSAGSRVYCYEFNKTDPALSNNF